MSKSEGQVLNFEKICRLCLAEKRSMSAIFSKKKSDKKVPLPERIMSCASLELYEGDGLPASICNKCLQCVNQSFAFKEQCEQADTTLRQYAQQMNANSEEASAKPTAARNTRMRNKKQSVERKNNLNDNKKDEFFEKAKNDDEEDSEVPSEALDLTQTVLEIQTSHKNSFEEHSLFRKLLSNKDIVVCKKNLMEKVVTDVEQKRLIIERLAQSRKNESCNEEFKSIHSNAKQIYGLIFCKECKSFMKRSSFAAHNRFVHKKIRKHLCQLCGYATHTNSILRQHIQAVHVGYTFECDKCFKKFNLNKRLRRHKEICHSNAQITPKKLLLCHYCGLNFSRPSHLKSHFLTHTDETPLQCHYCDRKFKFKWAMTQHERLHTGVKPYKCQYCDERFTQNTRRKTHEYKVHGNSNLKSAKVVEVQS